MSKLKRALQRAQEGRAGVSPLDTLIQGERFAPLDNKYAPQESALDNKISFNYSKTKVEKVDPDRLRKNRIISLFKANHMTEQIETLRTQLLAKLDERGGNSILVTSSHLGEGKTFISINLGISIAQQLDRTVLIIDTDLRNPWKHHYDFAKDFWGLRPGKGLADYLLEKAEIEDMLLNPGIEKLTILPAGQAVDNAAELLGSRRMEQFISDVKKRYGSHRICIFDSSALLRYTDALVMADMIDGILLVVEAERTSPQDLKRVLKLLEGHNILGTVFNKSRDGSDNHV